MAYMYIIFGAFFYEMLILSSSCMIWKEKKKILFVPCLLCVFGVVVSLLIQHFMFNIYDPKTLTNYFQYNFLTYSIITYIISSIIVYLVYLGLWIKAKVKKHNDIQQPTT